MKTTLARLWNLVRGDDTTADVEAAAVEKAAVPPVGTTVRAVPDGPPPQER